MEPADWVALIIGIAGAVAGFAGAFSTDNPSLRSKLIALGLALIVLAVAVAVFAPGKAAENSNTSPAITDDPNNSSPAPSDLPSASEPTILYDDEYLLSGNLDLDTDPPHSQPTLNLPEADLYINWGKIGGSGSSYAEWEDSNSPPTFGNCLDYMTRKSIEFHSYMDPKVGNSFCFRTPRNRMAWISILKITKNGILLRIVVWTPTA